MRKLLQLILAFSTLLYVATLLSHEIIECPHQMLSLATAQASLWVIQDYEKDKNHFSNTLINGELLNGKLGDEKNPYPPLLAPNQELKKAGRIIQTWNLEPNQSYLLICRYKNLDSYIVKALPNNLTNCKKMLKISAPQNLVPSGVIVESMICE